MTCTYLRYRPTLLCAAFMAVLCACQNKSNFTEPVIEDEKDSVTTWINSSKDKSLSDDVRKSSLDKAYTSILLQPNDSIRLEKFSKLALAYLRLRNYSKFLEINKILREQAQKIGDSARLADAYWDLGYHHEKVAVMDSSFFYYDEAHKLFLALDNKKSAGRMLRSMAVIQNNVRDYVQGERNIVRAIQLFLEIDDYQNLYKSYNSLGITAANLGEYEQALEYYDEALKYLNAAEEDEGYRLRILNNIGMAYLENGQYDASKDYFEEVIQYPNVQELTSLAYARALTNLGIAKMHLVTNPQKPTEFDEALLIQDSIEDIQGLSKTLYALADYYRMIGDSTQATERAWHALDHARRSNNNERELAALYLLTQVDLDSSAYYSNVYKELSDSLQLAERQMQNKFARVRFETDEVLAKNVTLTRQRTIWLGAALSFLLMALAIYIIAAQRTRNQKLKFLQEQQETNQEIFNLMMKQNQRLEEGKQLEQKRISEELHDGILGQMNGVRMVLLGLNGKEDPDSIKLRSEAIEKLQGIQEEIRNISHALSDASIQKVNNFLTSVIELLKATKESSGLVYTLDYDKDFDWDNLTGEIKINLYRILQECLQNCVKHANATEVSVDFSIANDEIQTTIKDNGRGFDVEKQKSGIGHKNIDSRVSKLGGSWYVDSRPGNGSLVIIFIPYKGMRSPITLSRPKSRKAPQNKKLVG